jgi:hypothetical protein
MSYLLIGGVFLGIGGQASTVREVQTLSMPVTMAQVVIFGLASLAVGIRRTSLVPGSIQTGTRLGQTLTFRRRSDLLPKLDLDPVAIEDPGELAIFLILAAEYLDPLGFELGGEGVEIVDPEIDHEGRIARVEIVARRLEL